MAPPHYSLFQQPTELIRGGHFRYEYSIENIEYWTAELGNKADYQILDSGHILPDFRFKNAIGIRARLFKKYSHGNTRLEILY